MLKIVGDICFADGYFDSGIGVGTRIKNGADPFRHLDRSPEDFWIGNFECVCSDRKDRCEFLVHPEDFSHIKHMDLYGIANNHINQYGQHVFNDTLRYLESAGCNYVGSVHKKSHIFNHQEKKIGIIAFCERPDNFTDKPQYWLLPEYADIKKEIDALNGCDFKIAYVHWGNEFMDYPYIDQKQLAHFLIDSGIDLVVGMHPHVLQGMETYNGKTIFYSIGNFVFDMAWEPTRQSLIVSVDLSGNVPEISYENIIIENMFPKHIAPEVVESRYRMDVLNQKCTIEKENEKYYAELSRNMSRYRKANYRWIASNLIKMNPLKTASMLCGFVTRRLKR